MNLFSSNIAAVMAFIAAGLITVILMQKKSKKDIRLLVYCLAAALFASVLLHFLASRAYKNDKLPSQLWMMLLPLTLSLAVATYSCIKTPLKTVQKKIYIGLSFVAVLSAIGLCFVSVNDYYHYYPTVGSLFGTTNRKEALLNQQSTALQFAIQTDTVRQKTIEGALYSAGDTLTAGTMTSLFIPGTVSHFTERSGFVYTPAIALKPGKINLPVIVLSAGVPGSTTDWLNGGDLKNTMDSFAAQHKGIAPYVFIVDNLGSGYNDTECVDSPHGNIETFLSQDVPAYIKAHYEVSSDASNWGIGGLSLGGLCGIMTTLRHPDVYTTFMDLGGENSPEVGSEQQTIRELFHGSNAEFEAHQPLLLMAKRDYPSIGGYFAIGKQDKKLLVDDMHTMFLASQKAKLNTVYEAIGGEHSFNVWAQSFRDALPWISNRLGATLCSGKCS